MTTMVVFISLVLQMHERVQDGAVPIRQYLEGTVVPILMQGLQNVTRERPKDPIEYLAMYLLKHKSEFPYNG